MHAPNAGIHIPYFCILGAEVQPSDFSGSGYALRIIPFRFSQKYFLAVVLRGNKFPQISLCLHYGDHLCRNNFWFGVRRCKSNPSDEEIFPKTDCPRLFLVTNPRAISQLLCLRSQIFQQHRVWRKKIFRASLVPFWCVSACSEEPTVGDVFGQPSGLLCAP